VAGKLINIRKPLYLGSIPLHLDLLFPQKASSSVRQFISSSVRQQVASQQVSRPSSPLIGQSVRGAVALRVARASDRRASPSVHCANRASFEPEPFEGPFDEFAPSPGPPAASRLPSQAALSELHVLDCRLVPLRDSVPAHVITPLSQQSIFACLSQS
jgi:hypothetical protein